MKRIILALAMIGLCPSIVLAEPYMFWYQSSFHYKSGDKLKIEPWNKYVDVYLSLEECDVILKKKTAVGKKTVLRSAKGFSKFKVVTRHNKYPDIPVIATTQYACFPVGRGPR